MFKKFLINVWKEPIIQELKALFIFILCFVVSTSVFIGMLNAIGYIIHKLGYLFGKNIFESGVVFLFFSLLIFFIIIIIHKIYKWIGKIWIKTLIDDKKDKL